MKFIQMLYNTTERTIESFSPRPRADALARCEQRVVAAWQPPLSFYRKSRVR